MLMTEAIVDTIRLIIKIFINVIYKLHTKNVKNRKKLNISDNVVVCPSEEVGLMGRFMFYLYILAEGQRLLILFVTTQRVLA